MNAAAADTHVSVYPLPHVVRRVIRPAATVGKAATIAGLGFPLVAYWSGFGWDIVLIALGMGSLFLVAGVAVLVVAGRNWRVRNEPLLIDPAGSFNGA